MIDNSSQTPETPPLFEYSSSKRNEPLSIQVGPPPLHTIPHKPEELSDPKVGPPPLPMNNGSSSILEDTSLTIGLNFTGSTLFTDSSFIPPDTMGGVGPDHIVELINGRYSVYDITDGERIQTSTLDQFWIDAGVSPSGSFAFDPRVAFDPFSERWYALSVDNAGDDNNFLFAVSDTSDPTQGWEGFAIDSDSTDQRWADFPMLGFDAEGVYLSANMFPQDDSNVTSVLTTIVVLPKDDLLAPNPTVSGATLFENNDPNTTGFTPRATIDLDNNPLPALLFSDFNTPAGFFKRSTIEGTVDAPILNTDGGFISVNPFNSPQDAEQPGTKTNIDTGDNRFSSDLVLQDGSVWGVQTVDNGGRAALRWFEIDADTNDLLQDGLIADSELEFYYGSIAVNEFDDVVIGFSGSSENQFVSTYAVLGQTNNGGTTFGEPLLLKEGVADYEILDGIGRNRWGDYSATVVDPEDPSTFWTFQEFVSSEDVWSTQITELKISDNGDAIENGSFETGDFSAWGTIGDTSIETTGFGVTPTDGSFQALLTNGFSDSEGSVEAEDLEEFLDLAPGVLDGLGNGPVTEGSAIKQTFNIDEPSILSFDWNFLTDEATPTIFNDFAFFTVNPVTLELADTNFPVFSPSDSLFNEETGYQGVSVAISEPGTYTLSFGVVDVLDEIVDSALLIDNVSVFPISTESTSYPDVFTLGSRDVLALTLGEENIPDSSPPELPGAFELDAMMAERAMMFI